MTTATLLALFAATFAATGVALGATLVLGYQGRRRAHLIAVALFLAGFTVTIGFAEAVGRRLEFDPLARSIHLPLAIVATVSTLLPIVTGFRLLGGRGARGTHRAAVVYFLGHFVAAMGTGIWMLATGKSPPP